MEVNITNKINELIFFQQHCHDEIRGVKGAGILEKWFHKGTETC
jgi:hypothetical protein